jgi:IPT/TIG domain
MRRRKKFTILNATNSVAKALAPTALFSNNLISVFGSSLILADQINSYTVVANSNFVFTKPYNFTVFDSLGRKVSSFTFSAKRREFNFTYSSAANTNFSLIFKNDQTDDIANIVLSTFKSGTNFGARPLVDSAVTSSVLSISFSSLTPSTVLPNQLITLSGLNFASDTSPIWTGGNTPAFTVVNAATITFLSPAVPGNYTVAGFSLTVTVPVIPPSYTSISPSVINPGTLVTLTGTNFISTTIPTWTGPNAPTFTFLNASTLTFLAPAVGNYVVGGLNLTVAALIIPPTYTSVTSGTLLAGQAITLTGANFTATTSPVWVGGNQPSFTFVNGTTITFTVLIPGNYTVGGLAFTVIAAPSFNSLNSSSVSVGSLVTLTGTNFTATTSPLWTGGNQPAFAFVNATTITFTAPAAGNYTVGGLAFTSIANPVYSSVAPSNPIPGDIVTLTGTNLVSTNPPLWTGGNQPAFTFVNATTITFTAPALGNYMVGGLAFTVVAAPTYTSLSPSTAAAGSIVTITGTSLFSERSPIWTGGTAPVFTFVNTTSITFVAPSAGSYTVGGLSLTTLAAPTYSGLQPASATLPGVLVSLRGNNHTSLIPPVWTGGNQPTFTFVNATTTRFNAPAVGNYTVGGLAFTSSATAPVFTSLSPSSTVAPGALVTLRGTNLSSTFPPAWTGANLPTFTYVSPTVITFIAPSVGSYSVGGLNITVSATAPNFTSLSSVSAAPGAVITITGTNFTAGTVATWVGANAPTITFVNATTLTFVSPSSGTYIVGGLNFTST